MANNSFELGEQSYRFTSFVLFEIEQKKLRVGAALFRAHQSVQRPLHSPISAIRLRRKALLKLHATITPVLDFIFRTNCSRLDECEEVLVDFILLRRTHAM
jgi:hypothetical protein